MSGNPASRTNEALQLRAFLSNYVQFTVRSRTVAIACAILMVSIVLAASELPVGGSQLPSSSSALAAGLLASGLLVIVITSAFLGGFAIANDYVHKMTSMFVFTLPVRRRTIFLGRYLGALGLGSAFLACYYAFAAGALLYYYGTIPAPFLASFLLALLFLASVMAFGFMFSAIMRTERLATYSTILLFFVCMPLLQAQLEVNNISPLPLLSFAGSAYVSIVGSSSLSGGLIFSLLGIAQGKASGPDPLIGLLITAAYLAASLAVGIFVCARNEIK